MTKKLEEELLKSLKSIEQRLTNLEIKSDKFKIMMDKFAEKLL